MLITQMQVVALYAGLAGLLLLVLAMLVSRARAKHKVFLGDGGNPALLRAQRAHGNAAEYVPLILVLMLTLAGLKASMLLLHIVGGSLIAGRILHAIGMYQPSDTSVGRTIGALLTWVSLLVAAVSCLSFAFA